MEHLAKRNQLWEARIEIESTGSNLTNRGNKHFVTEAADVAGVHRQHIYRAGSVTEKVLDELHDTNHQPLLKTDQVNQMFAETVIVPFLNNSRFHGIQPQFYEYCTPYGNSPSESQECRHSQQQLSYPDLVRLAAPVRIPS